MLDYRVWECIIYISGETESSSISRQRGSLHFHTCDTHAWIIGSGNNTSQKVDCQKVASLKVLLRLDWDHFVMVCLESLGSHFQCVPESSIAHHKSMYYHLWKPHNQNRRVGVSDCDVIIG